MIIARTDAVAVEGLDTAIHRMHRYAEAEADTGFVHDYSGIRVSSSGRRFRIEQAIVWNLVDESGMLCGQAATFDRWTPLTGN